MTCCDWPSLLSHVPGQAAGVVRLYQPQPRHHSPLIFSTEIIGHCYRDCKDGCRGKSCNTLATSKAIEWAMVLTDDRSAPQLPRSIGPPLAALSAYEARPPLLCPPSRNVTMTREEGSTSSATCLRPSTSSTFAIPLRTLQS